MKLSSKTQLIISIVAIIISECASAADALECVINKSYFEGGDTLTLTMPNALFGDGASALRIDIIDTETGKQLISCPFVTEIGDSTTVNIELPSCGIRTHEDIINFFSCLSASNDYLYVDAHKKVYLRTDWPIKDKDYVLYMTYANLKKIPLQNITYLSLVPDSYYPIDGKQPYDNGTFRLDIKTDKSFPVNNTFIVSVLNDDERIISFEINIHKIYFRQVGVNGKMLKAACPLLLMPDTEHFNERW